MLKTKRIVLTLLMGTLLIQTVSCSLLGETSTDESNAEQTLQAMYMDFTAQAESAANEIVETATIEAKEVIPTLMPTQPPQQPTKESFMMPGEPPEPERTLVDSNSSYKAHENRAVLGDNFLDSVYERPFTSSEMVYQPDLDILTVDFASDEVFFYFTINLSSGPTQDESGITGMYGIEFDRTKTGRGDLIVLVENPLDAWSVQNISVYDSPVQMIGNKVAFARLSPDNTNAVQIAVNRNLLENPEEFLWGAWADKGLKNVTLFDYNDTMGPTRAGSPYKDDPRYPLDELYSLDNTCRLPYGFDQIGANVRGMCITQPAPVSDIDCPNHVCLVKCFDRNDGCCEWGCAYD